MLDSDPSAAALSQGGVGHRGDVAAQPGADVEQLIPKHLHVRFLHVAPPRRDRPPRRRPPNQAKNRHCKSASERRQTAGTAPATSRMSRARRDGPSEASTRRSGSRLARDRSALPASNSRSSRRAAVHGECFTAAQTSRLSPWHGVAVRCDRQLRRVAALPLCAGAARLPVSRLPPLPLLSEPIRHVAASIEVDADQAFQQCLSPACGATFDVGEVRTACPKCGSLLDVAYDWDRLPPSRVARASSRRSGPTATTRSCFSAASGGSASCCRSPRPSKIVTIGEGQTLLQPADGVGRVRRPERRPPVPAVRGDEPLGQLQGQRHDGRVHARPHGRRQAGRLRLDRQHQRLARRLLLRDAG